MLLVEGWGVLLEKLVEVVLLEKFVFLDKEEDVLLGWKIMWVF